MPVPVGGNRGFNLIEVTAAMVILGFVLVGMVGTSGFLATVGRADRQAAANELANDRIEQVKMEPMYTKIDFLYAGTESSFPTLPGYTRTTTIVHVGGPTQTHDYKMITVTVSGPGLPAPSKRTVFVAAP